MHDYLKHNHWTGTWEGTWAWENMGLECGTRFSTIYSCTIIHSCIASILRACPAVYLFMHTIVYYRVMKHSERAPYWCARPTFLPDNVRAVQEVPPPKTVAELKSCLGLLTYYSKFLHNFSSALSPLQIKVAASFHKLVLDFQVFEASKQLLTSVPLLVHFNPDLEITLSCDASPYGLVAILSHGMPNGTEKPIRYASHTLTQSEQKYSQIEKDGLACVFCVKKFHS